MVLRWRKLLCVEILSHGHRGKVAEYYEEFNTEVLSRHKQALAEQSRQEPYCETNGRHETPADGTGGRNRRSSYKETRE